MKLSVLGLVLVTSIASSCLTEESALPLPFALDKVAPGDQQTAPAGGRLAMPLRVTARAADNSPSVRAEVQWSVVSGPAQAVLSDDLTLTDGFGVAEVALTLGPAEGTYTVRASLMADPDLAVTFTAIATAPPMLVGIAPATFTGGDVVTVTGSDLSPNVTFEVGGALAIVQSVVGGISATVAIPKCLSPGIVTVQAFESGAPSNELAATYEVDSDLISLAVGEYVSVSPDAIAGCATFPAPGTESTEYLITPQLVASQGADTVDYRLRGQLGLPVPLMTASPADPPSFATRFHDLLRQFEREIAGQEVPIVRGLAAEAVASVPITVGHRRDFQVCTVFPCRVVDDFETIRAEAMFVGQHAAIYQDLDAPSGGLGEEDFVFFGNLFDDRLYGVNTRFFGVESDVDENDLVVILLTPAVNGLTPEEECQDSFIAGFFFAADIDPNFPRDPRSNQAEVFYSIVPDPAGSVTCDHSVQRVRQVVPVTFVHEFQHMINYHQKVLVRGAGDSEVLWLNEGLSHLAEELAAVEFLALADSVNFNRFAIGNLVNLYRYLEDPALVSPLATSGTGSLAERGAAWLFLRWIVDRHGDDVIRRMSESALFGTENAAAAAGEPMDRMLIQWFLSNWVADLPAFDPPADLTYSSWDLRTTYASLNAQAPNTFEREYPLVPELFVSLSPFDRVGRIVTGSGEYFRLVQTPTTDPVVLQFTQPSGSPLDARGQPVLNIIRIK